MNLITEFKLSQQVILNVAPAFGSWTHVQVAFLLILTDPRLHWFLLHPITVTHTFLLALWVFTISFSIASSSKPLKNVTPRERLWGPEKDLLS
jgi:hypothetical protein